MSGLEEQVAYLLERSPFYGEKLAGHDATAGLAAIGQLPLTEKDELRATRTPENPFGTHLCAEPHDLLRIYSTSGTTGEPSYIPLTAGDLDERDRRVVPGELLPVERGALEQVGELLPEARAVDGELLRPGA